MISRLTANTSGTLCLGAEPASPVIRWPCRRMRAFSAGWTTADRWDGIMVERDSRANHPRLNEAYAQIGRMSHVAFGGITHEPAVRLGQALIEMTPEALSTVFLADSGSVSVEVAFETGAATLAGARYPWMTPLCRLFAMVIMVTPSERCRSRT